jgi:hypothetical protein
MTYWRGFWIFSEGLIVTIIVSIVGFSLLLRSIKGDIFLLNQSIRMTRKSLVIIGCIFQLPILIYITLWVFSGSFEFILFGSE